jgi:hypothetical protein
MTDFPVVLVDDGELEDVRDLLLELGVEFAHLRGGVVPRTLAPPRDLFVTTPRHAPLARPWPSSRDGSHRPVRIAVASEDSNAARALLRRLGFAYLVRRPVHPIVLRLLLLRALHRGEERRASPRVPVGVEVALRSGLRRRGALLSDLSAGGCALLTEKALPGGARVTVQIGSDVTGEEEGLELAGRVVRCERDRANELFSRGYVVAVRFDRVAPVERRRLERVLARLSPELGPLAAPRPPIPHPALLRAREPRDAERVASSTAGRGSDDPSRVGVGPSDTAPAGAPGPTAPAGLDRAQEPAPAGPALPPDAADAEPARLGASLLSRTKRRGPPPDRRRHARRPYRGRVIAAAEDAVHRLLFGRDLGMEGMRVDRHPDLELGARVRIAIYDPAAARPLVVEAVVVRDDAAGGLVLRFEGVDAELGARLEALVAALPPVEPLLEGEAGSLGTVVSEILS